jgi:hypothetical protein
VVLKDSAPWSSLVRNVKYSVAGILENDSSDGEKLGHIQKCVL